MQAPHIRSVESVVRNEHSAHRNGFQGSGIGQDMLLSSLENDVAYGSTLSTSPDKKSFD
jgi:hypothetical protein